MVHRRIWEIEAAPLIRAEAEGMPVDAAAFIAAALIGADPSASKEGVTAGTSRAAVMSGEEEFNIR